MGRGQGAHVDNDWQTSNIGLVYAGVDYRWSAGVVVGILAQVDRTEAKESVAGASADGTGWMAGPYAVARLDEHLIFDTRAAWGTSSNSVSPIGTYSDDFEGDRWLVRARLTGDFSYGAWIIAPQASVVYFSEQQQGYTDSNGDYIPGQTVALGQVEVGPKVGYQWVERDGTVVAPYAAVKGIWDFKEAPAYDVASGLAIGTGDVRARFEGGVAAAFINGWAINGEAFYDGVGTGDFSAVGGSLALSVPLE